VQLTEPVVFEAGQASHALTDLARALDRGGVTSLVVLGGNPAYTAPGDADLAAAMRRVANSVYVGAYDNETARACRFVVPGLHDFESWGLARAYDGTLTPIQPLIEPLFAGRSVASVLHRLLGDPPASDHDRLRAAWPALAAGASLDTALAVGVLAGSAAPVVAVEVAWGALAEAIPAATALAAPALELAIQPHPFVHDGRYTNNPWLLELPEPITKLTWDHAAQLSPATARRLGVGDGDVLALSLPAGATTLEVPAIIVPGHADDAITVHAGFGRDGGEHTARGIGANVFQLWTTAGGLTPAIAAVARGTRRPLAITQFERADHGRDVALGGTLRALAGDAWPRELAHHRGAQPSLFARRPGEAGRPAPGAMAQWAMSIDLTTCTGCSACVMACAAENNTPVVGRRQVRNGRAMHWLRIDRYYREEDRIAVQPMACQHCEDAPCEYVCPVEATTHSPDGLNEMTYNRCIGTRFCSNNCPYKVRRFNWFDFKEHTGLRVAARNPDVTVRDRGVMEKCTYCVQRIRRAEIAARVADRPLATDDVRTACQQACPTQAIAFGSLTDPASPVVAQRQRPHSHAALHDQGTAPRTQYLARIRNPTPDDGGALP
jgi:molybdopterin-containing oxidoreductase family iron-sulfur binding subunit